MLVIHSSSQRTREAHVPSAAPEAMDSVSPTASQNDSSKSHPPTQLKNMSQNQNLPQIEVNIKQYLKPVPGRISIQYDNVWYL